MDLQCRQGGADGTGLFGVAELFHGFDDRLDQLFLGELARVLVRGGRFVAVTNRATHLQEMFRLVGVDRWELPFGAENGEELHVRHFARVELRDGTGTVTFEGAGPIRAYFRSSERLSAYELAVPELDEPLVVHRRPVVFVADGPL